AGAEDAIRPPRLEPDLDDVADVRHVVHDEKLMHRRLRSRATRYRHNASTECSASLQLPSEAAASARRALAGLPAQPRQGTDAAASMAAPPRPMLGELGNPLKRSARGAAPASGTAPALALMWPHAAPAGAHGPSRRPR